MTVLGYRSMLEASTWGQGARFNRVVRVLPYVLLGLATALSLAREDQSWAQRGLTLGLAAVAAAWMLSMYTLRSAAWTSRPAPMMVYFAGLLVVASVLMHHYVLFFLVGIVPMLQANVVLTPGWAFVGIFLSSLLVNSVPAGLPPPNLQAISGWAAIICAQTVLIGWGSYLADKAVVEHEQRRVAMERLQASLEENAGLHAQLVVQAREAGVHDERQRLAREIHDTLAQGLTGIITQLQAAERAKANPQQSQRHLDHVHTLARDSLAAARRSVAALAPAQLEDSHLPGAIADLARRWSQTSGVPVAVQVTGQPQPMIAEIEITLFRVAQESLANIAKHAAAGKAGLTLSYLDDVVLLDVRDDGAGFDPAAVPVSRDGSGFGLDAIRQRLAQVRGTLEIESAPGDGTAVSACVPALPRQRAEDSQ